MTRLSEFRQRAAVRLLGLAALYGAGGDLKAEPESLPERAPPQYVQHLFLSRQHFPFDPPDPVELFEGKVLSPPPDILPAEAYESAPLQFDEPQHGGILQVSQEPLEDNAARDVDPDGHSAFPRWNPLPPPIPPPEGVWIPYLKENTLTATVLPAPGNDLGMTTVDWKSVIVAWEVNDQPVVQLTPRFAWNLADGPAGGELPGNLYDLSLEATFYFAVGDRWTGLVGAAPGFYSDFENTTAEAWRVTGRAMVFYEWSPSLKLAGGFLYLDREDIVALPAGGVIYSPNPSTRYELLFPRPRILHRFSLTDTFELWGYLAGELGGGSWAILNPAGVEDVVAYKDYRLIVGMEGIGGDSYRWLVEGGYVFHRQLEYRSLPDVIDQSPTAMLRAGFAF